MTKVQATEAKRFVAGSVTTRTDDIVGYTYNADVYCPECILRMFHDSPTGQPPLAVMSIEQHLDVLARMRGINRQDERSYDSGEFPKVLFRDQLQTEMVRTGSAEPPYEESIVLDRCCECRRVLGS